MKMLYDIELVRRYRRCKVNDIIRFDILEYGSLEKKGDYRYER